MAWLTFSDSARDVCSLANQEAHRLNHEYVGTEHLLLALATEQAGAGGRALRSVGLSHDRVRSVILQLVRCGPETIRIGVLPQTPRVKAVIGAAAEVARAAGRECVGTDHLLAAITQDRDCVAREALRRLGVQPEAMIRALGAGEVTERNTGSPGLVVTSLATRTGFDRVVRWLKRRVGRTA